MVARKGWGSLLVVGMMSLSCWRTGWAQSVAGAESPIVNGVVSSEFPSVGALLFSASGLSWDAQGICTGTLVGCQTFVTAAHCVCRTIGPDCQPGAGGAPNPAMYFVFLPHVGIVGVQSIAVRPDFDFPDGDVAVLHLSVPVENVRPSRLNEVQSPPTDTPATIVGYGLTSGSKRDYGVKRSGNVVTTECTGNISPTNSVCWAFRSPLGAPGSNSNTCFGDSGGPLFIDFGSGPVLAGITSGGNSENCSPPDNSFDANVFTYRNWIALQAGGDLTNTACGSGPQVGDAGAAVLAYSGALSGGQSVAYEFTVPPGTRHVRVTANATRDFDLYVRQAPGVTTSVFDCKDDAVRSMSACTFSSPSSGPWSALVYAYRDAGTYQFTVTMVGTDCSSSPDGAPCDDGNDCTANDTCQSGTCVGTSQPDGTPCSDGNRCTNPDQCVSGVCVGGSAPRTTCKQVGVARAGALRLARPSSRPPTLVWRWRQGQATDLTDFGDPRGSSDYDVCVYETQGGQPMLSWQKNVAAGGLCDRGRGCWLQTRRGFRYTNRNGAPGGIKELDLVGGPDGKSSVSLRAGTNNLVPPPLPLSLPVIVQLANDRVCWEATFSSPSVNMATEFRSRSDP